MSANLVSLYAQQFATAVALLSQQKGSVLESAVMSGMHVGEQASPVDQIGVVEMHEVLSRFEPIVRTDAPVDRRWIFPKDFDLAQQIDNLDKLRLIVDPQSAQVQSAVYAAGRQKDRLILNMMSATNKTGKNGSTSTDLASTQKVGVNVGGTNSRLNVKKIRNARQILMSNNIDLKDPMNQAYLAVNGLQHDALLSEAQVTSLDFNDRPVLKDGFIERFLGFNIIHTELIETVSGAATSDAVMAWVKSGVYLGKWEDMKTDVSQRKDLKSLPWQIYLQMTAAATRLEEKKVVQIAAYNA